jgi:hypothetical protein
MGMVDCCASALARFNVPDLRQMGASPMNTCAATNIANQRLFLIRRDPHGRWTCASGLGSPLGITCVRTGSSDVRLQSESSDQASFYSNSLTCAGLPVLSSLPGRTCRGKLNAFALPGPELCDVFELAARTSSMIFFLGAESFSCSRSLL